MATDKCMQEKCSHNPLNTQFKGTTKDLMCAMCPVCDTCSAPPHEITNGCDNCLLCENKEGYIRRGQPKPFLEIGVKEKEDVEVVKQMVMVKKQQKTE